MTTPVQYVPDFGRPAGQDGPQGMPEFLYPEPHQDVNVELVVCRPGGETTRDLHWFIRWRIGTVDLPGHAINDVYRMFQIQREFDFTTGEPLPHLTNWGAITSSGAGDTPETSPVIVIKAMGREDRKALERIANETPVRVPDGDWNCQNWCKTVLLMGVDMGLLSKAEYDKAISIADSVDPTPPQGPGHALALKA